MDEDAHDAEPAVPAPGVHDALSAKIACDALMEAEDHDAEPAVPAPGVHDALSANIACDALRASSV